MSDDESTAMWLTRLVDGREDATERLWNEYYTPLVLLARQKLAASRKRVADEEDLALSVLDSFCRAAANGRFPKLDDRDDLWRLLFTLMDRKAIRQVAAEKRQKRGGGRVRGDSAFSGPDPSRGAGIDRHVASREPTADEALEVAERMESLLALLPDKTLRDVATAKLEGFTNGEIASQLDCSDRTIKRRLQMIRTAWIASIGESA